MGGGGREWALSALQVGGKRAVSLSDGAFYDGPGPSNGPPT